MATPITAPTVNVYRGDTTPFFSYTVAVRTDPEDPLSLVPVDLVAAGWSNWVAHWRRSTSSADFIAMVVDTSQASVGRISVKATSAQTEQMIGAGYWDLQATRPSEVRTFVKGQTTFEKDVTRA